MIDDPLGLSTKTEDSDPLGLKTDLTVNTKGSLPKRINEDLYGIVEGAEYVGTSLLGGIAGMGAELGILGLSKAMTGEADLDTARTAGEKVAKFITREPTTEAGQFWKEELTRPRTLAGSKPSSVMGFIPNVSTELSDMFINEPMNLSPTTREIVNIAAPFAVPVLAGKATGVVGRTLGEQAKQLTSRPFEGLKDVIKPVDMLQDRPLTPDVPRVPKGFTPQTGKKLVPSTAIHLPEGEITGTDAMRPAIIDSEGHIHVGKVGDRHADIVNREKMIEGQRIFVDREGNPIDRAGAAIKLQADEPKVAEKLEGKLPNNELHSEDLNKAREDIAKSKEPTIASVDILKTPKAESEGKVLPPENKPAVEPPTAVIGAKEGISEAIPALEDEVRAINEKIEHKTVTKEDLLRRTEIYKILEPEIQKEFAGLKKQRTPEDVKNDIKNLEQKLKTVKGDTHNELAIDLATLKTELSAMGEEAIKKESLGAAAEGEGTPGTPMSQLTERVQTYFPEEKLKGVAKAKVNINEYLMQEWDKIKNTYQVLKQGTPTAQDAVKMSLNKMTTAFDMISEAAKNPIQFKEKMIVKSAAKWTIFKKDFGEMQAFVQTASRQAYIFSKEIKRAVLSPAIREAITNYVQANGDLALLKERYEKSLKNPDTVKYASGYRDAMQLSGEQKILAEQIRQFHEHILDILIENGVLKQGVENYVKQAWEKKHAKAMEHIMGGNIMDANPSLAKKRIYDSYFDGEQAGKHPITKDIGELVSGYSEAAYKALGTKNLIDVIKTEKASDGRPLVAPRKASSDPVQDIQLGVETADYKAIHHSALQEQTFHATKNGTPISWATDLKVHPEIYDQLNAVLGKSAFQDNGWLAKTGRGALKVSKEYKSALLSGIPTFFHQVHVGSHAIFRGVNPFIKPQFDIGADNAQFAMKHGVRLVGDNEALSYWQEGAFGSKNTYVQRVPFVGELSRQYGDYFFANYLPALKLNAFDKAMEYNTKKYSHSLSKDQIGELSGRQVEASFGELNYEWLGRSKTTRDLFRLIGLAPDFMEARVRFVGGMFKPEGGLQRRTLMIDTACMYLGAATINAVLNDGDWEKALKNPFKIVYEGREYSLRSIPADVYHLATDPTNYFTTRLNPAIVRPLITMFNHYDTRGKYRDGFDQVADYIKGATPIAAQGFFKEGDTRLWMTAMRAVGVNVYEEVTPFERELKKQYAKTISVTQPREEREQSSLIYNYTEQLRHSFKYDGDKEWEKKLDDVQKEIKEKVAKGKLPPNTEETVVEKLLTDRTAQTLKPMGINAIMDAVTSYTGTITSEQKDYYFPLFWKKLQNYSDVHPDKAPKTIERFKKVFKDQLENMTPEREAEIEAYEEYPQYIEKSKKRTIGKAPALTLEEPTKVEEEE